jgi:methionyl-tRNA synthetase
MSIPLGAQLSKVHLIKNKIMSLTIRVVKYPQFDPTKREAIEYGSIFIVDQECEVFMEDLFLTFNRSPLPLHASFQLLHDRLVWCGVVFLHVEIQHLGIRVPLCRAIDKRLQMWNINPLVSETNMTKIRSLIFPDYKKEQGERWLESYQPTPLEPHVKFHCGYCLLPPNYKMGSITEFHGYPAQIVFSDKKTLVFSDLQAYLCTNKLTNKLTTRLTTISNPSRYYISTAINYTNGPPHIGHAYEAIVADILARWHREVQQRLVFFQTGTDEHGQKIAHQAQEKGLCPLELCNLYVASFQSLASKLNISHDAFVRTTDAEHKRVAQSMFQKIWEKGDIYLGEYSGWYSEREERFLTELDAKETNFRDPISGVEYKHIQEPSYFFKMEKYRTRVIEFVTNLDKNVSTAILPRLQEPLLDLSITRTSFEWGIPIPILSDSSSSSHQHILYVWFDALVNYISKVDDAWWNESTQLIHVIGKDIVWFHVVIWPCMLLSANLPLPKQILVHGFVQDAKGRKMSKSLGNCTDPLALLDSFPEDVLRYALIRTGSFGLDIKFSTQNLVQANHELGSLYGNLVNRMLQLLNQNSLDNKDISPRGLCASKTRDQMEEAIQKGDPTLALHLVMQQVSQVNAWLQKKEPWKRTSDIATSIETILHELVNQVLEITYLLEPFLPKTCQCVLDRLKHNNYSSLILFPKMYM